MLTFNNDSLDYSNYLEDKALNSKSCARCGGPILEDGSCCCEDEIDFDALGPTGHGDICWSDADPGL